MCLDRRDKAVGEVFNYVAAFHPDFSVWLLILYDEFAWAVMVTTSDTAASQGRNRGRIPVPGSTISLVSKKQKR